MVYAPFVANLKFLRRSCRCPNHRPTSTSPFGIHQSGFCGYHKDLATANLHKVALQEKTMDAPPRWRFRFRLYLMCQNYNCGYQLATARHTLCTPERSQKLGGTAVRMQACHAHPFCV